MRLKKHNIFIVISSIALITVLIIQVNWMLETAKIKEELFNEKANIVLARTSEALLSDSKTCRNIDSCIGKKEISKIDSLFKHYMDFYNFHIDFTFEIISNLNKNKFENSAISFINKSQPACYQKNLNELSNKTGVELKLILPKKNKFISAEMGNLFISSVLE